MAPVTAPERTQAAEPARRMCPMPGRPDAGGARLRYGLAIARPAGRRTNRCAEPALLPNKHRLRDGCSPTASAAPESHQRPTLPPEADEAAESMRWAAGRAHAGLAATGPFRRRRAAAPAALSAPLPASRLLAIPDPVARNRLKASQLGTTPFGRRAIHAEMPRCRPLPLLPIGKA